MVSFCAAVMRVCSMLSRSRPAAWTFSNGQQIYFNAGGSHPAAALVGRTAHAAPSAMSVLGSMIPDGAYLI
jgi:hypothetical protein